MATTDGTWPGARLAVNLSLVFTERPLVERFAAAAARGFRGVELQFPYEVPAATLAAAAQRAAVEIALINVPAGELLRGGTAPAGDPARQAEFAAALDACETYVRALRPACVNVLSGPRPAAFSRSQCLDTFCANLAQTRERLAPLGVTTVFEAINTFDMPDFLIDGTAEQRRILERLGDDNLKLQYDVYHMVRMGEDVAGFLTRHAGLIGHVQFADVPGRGEPGTGTIDFAKVLAALDAGGYAGWLAAEYSPSLSSARSFDWLARSPFRGRLG
jgi:hydroxypyruvate isomerase